MATKKTAPRLVTAHAARKFVLPKAFVFPEIPVDMLTALDETLGALIDEYLPPEWAKAIHAYAYASGIRPGDEGDTLSEFAEWVDDLHTLQKFLVGLRSDETGHFSEWVGPAPKLGQAREE